MSEIQDAAQIIKVSFEGAEIILKMGNTGWQFVKDICAVFKKSFGPGKTVRENFCTKAPENGR